MAAPNSPEADRTGRRSAGINLLFTHVRSPRSSGEHLVETLKRAYAPIDALSNDDTIVALLPGWIDDYLEVDPHSGFKFR